MIALLGEAFVTALEGHAIGLRQARGEDPHELGGRRRPHLGPCVREMVLHGRVLQTESVGRSLLGAGTEDGFDHADLAIRRSSRSPLSHASRRAAASHSSRPSIGIS